MFYRGYRWTPWYAWYPVRTLSGKFAWLKTVERRFNPDLLPWCDSYGYSGYDGDYEYRLVPVPYKDVLNYGKTNRHVPLGREVPSQDN